MPGFFASLESAILGISGMSTLLPSGVVWFGYIPDRSAQPPGCLMTDPQGRDELIRDAEFEVDQVYVYNPLVEFWTRTLADCETWAGLMDERFAFGELEVDGFTVMPESIEVGKVQFNQEKMLDTNTNLVHHCRYPMRIPLMKESGD